MKTVFEFFQNGKEVNNFKLCDLIFFMQGYKYSEVVINEAKYIKFIMSDDDVTDVWEVYEKEERIGE